MLPEFNSTPGIIAKKIPVIIDTDPGVDDILAILFALASPEIEILAFVVSFGNTDINSSYLNLFKTYHVLDRHIQCHPEDRARFINFRVEGNKPYILKGPSGPLNGELHSAQYFHGRDGLGNISQRHPDLSLPEDFDFNDNPYFRICDRVASEVVLEIIEAYPARSITYIVLGPMTNLALMLRENSILIRESLGRVISMGGAIDVPGNTSATAEFNIFADPFAAHDLLTPDDPKAGLPLDRFLLLPLDVTVPHELSFHSYIRHVDQQFKSTEQPSKPENKPPLHHFTSSFLERTREVMLEFGKDALELHDVVAVWCAITNPPNEISTGLPSLASGWKVQGRKFQVERIGELTRGMLVVDRRDDAGAYELGANRAKAQAGLERALKSNCHDINTSSIPAPVQVEVPEEIIPSSSDVLCVTHTPGLNMLQHMMLRRIWGAEVDV